ncbi:MAG: hypothetical protein JSR80_03790 [Verrucomicrobia bacterium]|nr:hypothetical protein [Verrucomicrobiota bacterium]
MHDLLIRPKSPFFTPPLLLSLLVAVFLHLGAFFLFHLKQQPLLSSPLLPPIAVSIELGFNEELPPPIDVNGLLPRSCPCLCPSQPTLPPLEENLLVPLPTSHLEPTKLNRPPSRDYAPLEPLTVFAKIYSPRTVHLTGAVRKLQLISTPSIEQRLCPLNKKTTTHYLRYRVKIDEATGKIYSYSLAPNPLKNRHLANIRAPGIIERKWVHISKDLSASLKVPQLSSRDLAVPPTLLLEQEAQEVLKQLAFSPKARGGVCEGFVEITLTHYLEKS